MQVIVTAIIDQRDVASFAACTSKVGKLLCYSSTVEDVSRATFNSVLADHAEHLAARQTEAAA